MRLPFGPLALGGILFALGAGMTGAAPSHEASEARGVEGPRVLRVGPSRSLTRIEQAAKVARDGDIVEIDAGVYTGDVASWHQNRLTIRAVGGKARIMAAGRAAEEKAIWVVKGNDVVIEHLEFFGARVDDENGAGIRHEGPGRLVIRDCRFSDNEMGLLSSSNPLSELIIERSEFDRNVVRNPRSPASVGHQIYVGRIGRFTLRESYFHHGHDGHLVKSRARENVIEYNRLTDEEGGRASYELEFPDGGIAYVIGNIIAQGRTTENAAMIAFAAERFYWPRNELYLSSNTLIDERARVLPVLRVRPGTEVVKIVNNLLYLGGRFAANGLLRTQLRAVARDLPGANRDDFRLAAGSELFGAGQDPGSANGIPLRPTREYVHPRRTRPLSTMRLSPGAMQSPHP